MNTHQLEVVLSKDPCISPVFKGVFAIDELCSFESGAYVINTDPATNSGKHWVAVYATPTQAEYFDSYGGEPIARLKKWWEGKWNFNPISLQSPLSAVCGQYCIYYLHHRTRGENMNTILMNFGADVDYNDQLVYEFVEEKYNLDGLKLLDTEGVVKQLARARISSPSIRKLTSGQ